MYPKTNLERAVLKHTFEEQAGGADTVSGSESVQLARSSYGFPLGEGRPVALSRGRTTLKLWDVESGTNIYTHDEDLYLTAVTLTRDASHMLRAYSYETPTGETTWSAAFKQTARMISCNRGGSYAKSNYANARYFSVRGELVSVDREHTVEVDRAAFAANPIKGKILPPPKKFPPEYLAMLSKEDREAHLNEPDVVRVSIPQTVTIAHEEIEGYLPAQTTAFTICDGFYGPKVSDLNNGSSITATLAVEDEEAWIEGIVAPGLGLKGLYKSFTTPVTALCLSSDGSLALSNGDGNTFRLWNIWTGQMLREFSGHADRVTCLCLSIDASFAVSGSEDRTLKLWKPISAECVRTFVGHQNTITAVCLSMDTARVLSASEDGTIKLWDSLTGECLLTIQAHSQSISGLHLTVDGKFAASGSWDKTIKLWNLSDGSCMQTLAHSDWVTSVDITPDGGYLVSSGYDATKVWELTWEVDAESDGRVWDARARRYLEILMNANAAWERKLGTGLDMTDQEIANSLQRQGPSWIAWHEPSKGLWHLGWDIEETLGHAGYGQLSGVNREVEKIMERTRAKLPK